MAINPEMRQYELAILYDGGTPQLTGDKLFSESLGGHSTIAGHLNGHLNLTQLYRLANNNGEPYRFTNIHLGGDYDHLDMESELIVGRSLETSSFNGLNLTDILANTLQ